MNGYPPIKTGHTYRVTGQCWKGWAQDTVVTVISVDRKSVVTRRHDVLDVNCTLTTSTFRAMFEEVYGVQPVEVK